MSSIENKEPTTTDILEALQQFSGHVDQKFDAIDRRFEALEQKMDQRFDQVDQRFDRIESRLSAIEHDLDDIKEQISRLEQRTREDADSMAQELSILSKRVDWLETQVKQLRIAS